MRSSINNVAPGFSQLALSKSSIPPVRDNRQIQHAFLSMPHNPISVQFGDDMNENIHDIIQAAFPDQSRARDIRNCFNLGRSASNFYDALDYLKTQDTQSVFLYPMRNIEALGILWRYNRENGTRFKIANQRAVNPPSFRNGFGLFGKNILEIEK